MSEIEPNTDVAKLWKALGELLRERRKSTGRTQKTLSRELGNIEDLKYEAVTDKSISRYENGDKVSAKVVMEILRITDADRATKQRAIDLLEQIQAAADTPVPPPPVSGDSSPDSDATPPPAIPHGQQHGRLDGHRLDRARHGQLLGQVIRGDAEREHSADGPPQPLRKSNRWLIPAAVVVVLMVVTALAIMQPWAGVQDSDRGQQSATSAPTSAGRPSRACVPPATTEEVTGSPSSTALSSDRAAYAEFYRDQSLLVLIDKRKDNRSAALWVKIDGKRLPLFSNCYGKTGVPRKDGKIAPPKIISLPGVGSDTVVEFMACVAEDATDVIEASCGKWAVDQPR